MEYLLTVIIPNRNIFNLLSRCLDSVPRREDIQIIVVDDASEMSEDQRKSYPGISDPYVEVVFTDEGKGAGFARNIALDHAKGEWLMFVDSDDFLLSDSLRLIDRYSKSDNDIVFFNIESRYSDTLTPAWRHEKFHKAFSSYSGEQLDKFLRYGYTEPWGKLIRRSIVLEHGIRFDESLVANDYMFSVKTGHHAGRIGMCHEPIVCVTVREGSLCDDYFGTDAKTMSRLGVYAGVQRFFDDNNIELEPLFRFVRGIRGNKGHLFSMALTECRRYGYSAAEVLIRSLVGFFRNKFKSKHRFC